MRRALLFSFAVLLGWTFNAKAQDYAPEPTVLDSVGVDQKLGEQIPLSLVFRDEAGDGIALGRLFNGRPVIVVPAYYECPMLCTQILNGLLSGLRPLNLNVGEAFDIVTVSFDPGEGPELAAAKKAAYVSGYDRPTGEAGWRFLTGDQASISALMDAMGYRYAHDPETDEYVHASAIMILTPDGKLARYLFGVEFAPRDLKLGLLEASQNRIGSPVDAVLLYCFQYNPLTGKYSLAIYRLVRIAGGIMVAGLVAFLIVMLRREKRALQTS